MVSKNSKDNLIKSETLPPKTARRRSISTNGISVGIIAPDYGLAHVSYSMTPPNVSYYHLNCISARRLDLKNQFWAQAPLIIGPRTDLVHTFNKLPIQIPMKRPFVVSAELELPRILGTPKAWQTEWALDALENQSCRSILALSNAARDYITKRLSLAGRPNISTKISVFRGTVGELETKDRVKDNNQLRFLYVGSDGLRKGLGIAVRSVTQMRQIGINATLTAIGRPTETSYVIPGRRISNQDLNKALSHTSWLQHYDSLPNARIRKLMCEHDVLLLPTVDESLGWVIIEAALCGLPTISTSIFAIRELIIDRKTGWLLSVDVDEDGRWKHLGHKNNQEEWECLQDKMESDIVKIAEELSSNPKILSKTSEAARSYLGNLYERSAAEKALSSIYYNAIG